LGDQTVSLAKYKPMTQKQLKEIVADYASTFPNWEGLSNGSGFSRNVGPIRQIIWFQKMNYAAYRPTHVMNVTALPMPRMLHQLLDVKHQTTEYSRHERDWRDVLAAMEQQFKPDIRRPLDVVEVLTLCETEARRDTTNDLAILAILHAWLGHDTEARAYCERMQRGSLPMIAPIPEWEEAMRSFGDDLAKAVDVGTAREFLDAAARKTSRRIE
jgi:hypothetical protein